MIGSLLGNLAWKGGRLGEGGGGLTDGRGRGGGGVIAADHALTETDEKQFVGVWEVEIVGTMKRWGVSALLVLIEGGEGLMFSFCRLI